MQDECSQGLHDWMPIIEDSDREFVYIQWVCGRCGIPHPGSERDQAEI